MNINLKYSKNLLNDYRKLSNGRKTYIEGRAESAFGPHQKRTSWMKVKSYLFRKYRNRK